jgi:hypothetical protein
MALSTRARADMMALAAESLLWALGDDPRVRQAYIDWRHGGGPARVEQLCHDLGLARWTWLPSLLEHAFQVSTVGLTLSVTPAATRRLSGRRPKGGGQHVARDVTWFYRRKVKQPPDRVSALAREYAGSRHVDNPRVTVLDGIARAETLLNSFTGKLL